MISFASEFPDSVRPNSCRSASIQGHLVVFESFVVCDKVTRLWFRKIAMSIHGKRGYKRRYYRESTDKKFSDPPEYHELLHTKNI
jgi:hypothetical protein